MTHRFRSFWDVEVRGEVEGRIAGLAFARPRIGAITKKQSNTVDVPSSGRVVKWRLVVKRLGPARIGAGAQKDFNRALCPLRGAVMQWSTLVQHPRRVNCRAVSDQGSRGGIVISRGGNVEWGANPVEP